jgi:hypothetical protein
MRVRYFLVVATLLIASPSMAESWVNESSHFCLDTDGRAANGALVRMWKCVTHPNQTWTVSPVSGGSFRLINRSSNFCLDTDGTARNGGEVRMWACVDHPNQLWQIQNLPDGRYRLRNRASGFCLDTNGAAANGGLVRMWQCVAHPNQSWSNTADFEEMNRISPTGTFGGPGGGQFESACPAGSFLTGLRARSGAWIDAVSPLCSRWVGGKVLGEIDPLPFNGGGGGGESFIRCHGPRGVIVGLQITQANNEDQSIGHITVDCGDFKQPSEFANKLGGSADYFGQATARPRMEARCGWGLVAAGIYGKSGAYVDRLGLLCRRPP